jgi:hypothetical protein
MTIKAIADLCGVDERTVLRWAHKDNFHSDKMSPANGKMSLRNSILEKLEHGSPERPSDFDLEEVLAIIESGGNATLAALLRENAANKSTLTLVSKSKADPSFIEQIVEAKMNAVLSRCYLPAQKRTPSQDIVRAHKEISQVLSAMRKWQDGYFIVSHAEFDRVVGLLMSAKSRLTDG